MGKGAGVSGDTIGNMLNAAVNQIGESTGMAKDIYNTAKPVQNEVSSQILDLLREGPSGNIGAINPSITRAVESSKLAGAQQQAKTGDEMARFGMTGTPAGQSIIQQMAQAGELQRSQIPVDMQMNYHDKMLGALLPAAMGGLPLGMQGMGGSTSALSGLAGQGLGIGAQQNMANMGMFQNLFSSILGAAKPSK